MARSRTELNQSNTVDLERYKSGFWRKGTEESMQYDILYYPDKGTKSCSPIILAYLDKTLYANAQIIFFIDSLPQRKELIVHHITIIEKKTCKNLSKLPWSLFNFVVSFLVLLHLSHDLLYWPMVLEFCLK